MRLITFLSLSFTTFYLFSQHYHGIGSDYIYSVRIDDTLDGIIRYHHLKKPLGMTYTQYKTYVFQKNPELSQRGKVYTGMRLLIPTKKEILIGRKNVTRKKKPYIYYKPLKRPVLKSKGRRVSSVKEISKDIHVVRPRETLSIIVFKYYKTDFAYWMGEFKKLNQLSENPYLYKGMRLKIPRKKRGLSSLRKKPIVERKSKRDELQRKKINREEELQKIWVDDIQKIDLMGDIHPEKRSLEYKVKTKVSSQFRYYINYAVQFEKSVKVFNEYSLN